MTVNKLGHMQTLYANPKNYNEAGEVEQMSVAYEVPAPDPNKCGISPCLVAWTQRFLGASKSFSWFGPLLTLTDSKISSLS